MAESELLQAINDGLKKLQIDDETFSEYISQICLEETIEADEKREAITEFLAEATDSSTESFVTTIIAKADKVHAAAREREEEERAKALEAVREKEKAVLTEHAGDAEVFIGGTSDKKKMSKEEMQRRERLLAQYGYDLDEVVEREDGEVEILYKGSGSSSADSNGKDELLMKNTNADVVKQAELAKRAKAQAEHQKQVQRQKELLEKQRLEKEKEKRRTQKREKRRM
ncbi:hypothetical protein HK102_007447 [Quaeritorhiza haematococci]|nr:hypothetical protein HK102_007447 [Quaeritorhiza haematococci]